MGDLETLWQEVHARAGDVPRMLPAAAYTSGDVHAWEQRQLFAGSWTCLGRLAELLPEGTTQRAATIGDVPVLLVRDGARVRSFANTCRHRGHELLAAGEASGRQSILCPYHAWTYRLSGDVLAAPGFRDQDFDAAGHALAELPVEVWSGWVFGHGLHPLGSDSVVPFEAHLGDLARILAPYDVGSLTLADRHTYEVAANWKVVAENYHECYHCPLIHPELCLVSPPASGDNYDLPGSWVGGAMELREGMATMSLTGESGGLPLPGVPADRVEYLHLLPNLLVSAHPDYVMAHRLVPLAPGRTWIECSWYLLADDAGVVPDPAYAVDFWDLTNRQDWAACESVQRGLASPHFVPGPFAPNEDAVARFVGLVQAAYASATGASDESASRPGSTPAGASVGREWK